MSAFESKKPVYKLYGVDKNHWNQNWNDLIFVCIWLWQQRIIILTPTHTKPVSLLCEFIHFLWDLLTFLQWNMPVLLSNVCWDSTLWTWNMFAIYLSRKRGKHPIYPFFGKTNIGKITWLEKSKINSILWEGLTDGVVKMWEGLIKSEWTHRKVRGCIGEQGHSFWFWEMSEWKNFENAPRSVHEIKFVCWYQHTNRL